MMFQGAGQLAGSLRSGLAGQWSRNFNALLNRYNAGNGIALWVDNGNLPAVRLYESEGFRFVSRVELFYEDTGLTDFLLYEYAL